MYGLSALRLGQKEFAMKEFQEAEKLQPNVEIIKQAIAMTEKGETLTLVGENQEPEVADNADKKMKSKTKKIPRKTQDQSQRVNQSRRRIIGWPEDRMVVWDRRHPAGPPETYAQNLNCAPSRRPESESTWELKTSRRDACGT